jgi:TolB-like protein
MRLLLCLVWAGCINVGWLAAQTDSIPYFLNTVKADYEKGDLAAAQPLVQRVLSLDPQNYHALKYKQLMDAQTRAKAAVAAEATIDVKAIKPNTMAIVNFVNTGSNKDLDPLQKGLAEMLITDLSQVTRMTMVERAQMQALYTEMGLAQTGLLDEKKSVQVGKFLGAATIVNGSFKSDDGKAIGLDAGLAGITGAKPKAVEPVKGQLAELFKLEKNLAFNIIKKMNIALTPEERKKIETVPTENVLAFLAYSRGLDAEDRADFGAAQGFYAEAVKADPNIKCPSVQPLPALPAPPAAAPAPAPVPVAAPATEQMTTPVFMVGKVPLSANTEASLSALNAVNSSFMPEAKVSMEKAAAPAAGTAQAAAPPLETTAPSRNSYIDSYGLQFDGATKSVTVKIPIP